MPEDQRGSRRRLLRRAVAALAVAGLVVVGYYAGLIVVAARDITRVDALTLSPRSDDAADTFLIVTRSPGNEAFLLVTAGATSSAVILPARGYVDVPACPDSVGRAGGPTGGALADVLLGRGPVCLVGAVELLSGLRVDHYLQIDLDATAAVVDAVGGLGCPGARRSGSEVLATLTRPVAPAARGEQARVQQRLLAELMGQLSATRRVLHPVGTTRLVRGLTRALTVDHGTGLSDLQRLTRLLRGLGTDAVPVGGVPLRRIDYRPVGPPDVVVDNPGADDPVDPLAPVDLLVEPLDRSLFTAVTAPAASEPTCG